MDWLEIFLECINHSRGIRSIRQGRAPQRTTTTGSTRMVCMVLFQVEIEDRVTLPNSQGLDSISIYLVASYDLIACAMAGSY